ncbi:MAG: TonB-dependent receptor [Pseudomonadota bacterium]
MKRSLLMSAVTSAFVMGGANGQTVESTGDDDEVRLDPISVYATKNPIPAFDYPGQVTVVDRDLILDFNPSTIQDVFQAVPGAQFDSGPRRTGDAPSIRGVGTNGVLIFLDGARQNFVSGHDGRFFVDPELIQTLEVVRGPTSALYGSGALGGVIATQTVTARDLLADGEQAGVRLTSGFQSVNDEFRFGGTAAWQTADGLFDVVGNVTYRDSGNIELGNDFTLPADDEILSSLLKTTVRPTDDLELYASWIRYNGDSTDPQNPQGLNIATATNELVFRDVESNTFQGGVNWNPATNDLINFNFVGYYTENSVEEDEVENPRTTDRSVETFGFTFDNRSAFSFGEGIGLTFTYGGEYFEDDQTGLDTETADGSRGGVPDASTDFFGLFVQADLSLTDLGPIPGELTIIPGVRWDSFDTSEPGGTFDIDEDEVSAKLGISYKPIPEFLIFANYAEGFRAPSFNEAFADGVHFTVPNLTAPPGPFGPTFVSNLFIPNADLEPEDSQTYEIGAGVDLDGVIFADDVFTVKASYYNTDADNLISLDVQTPAGCFVPALVFFQPCGTGPDFGNTSQNINVASARIEGFELEFGYDSDYFYTRGNIATINGTDENSGEFLEGVLFANTLFIDSGLKWEPWGLRGGVRMTFADDFNDVNDPAEARNGFIFGDVYAVWEPPIEALEGVRLDLGIDNVADTDFDVVFAGVSQPGRNYKVALSWSKGF